MDLIKDCYTGRTAGVKGVESRAFPLLSGERQGCPLSPFLLSSMNNGHGGEQYDMTVTNGYGGEWAWGQAVTNGRASNMTNGHGGEHFSGLTGWNCAAHMFACG